jgi:pseudouridine kinase
VLSIREGPVLVIGSAGIDLVGRASSSLQTRTSNPGHLRLSHGGVARNVAENLARLGTEVTLISAVGEDDQGRALLSQASEAGVNVDHALEIAGASTGAYLAVLDADGSLHLGLDDMQVIEHVSPSYLREREALFEAASVVFCDANLMPESLEVALALARKHRTLIAADPTSASLATKFTPHLKDLWLLTPNEAEAEVLYPGQVPHADVSRALSAARHLVQNGVEIAVITMAEFGLGYAWAEGSGHVPAVRTEILDPTGAGDALSAALIFALSNGIPVDEAARLGLAAAAHTLRTPGSVAADLSLELLYDELR